MILSIIFLILGLGLIVLLFLYFFPIVKVIGDSMFPTYHNGEYILGISKFNINKIKIGDILVFKKSGYDKILIKRVGSIHEEEYSDKKSFFMLGDNSEYSNDSRNFGWVEEEELMAKILKPRNKVLLRS